MASGTVKSKQMAFGTVKSKQMASGTLKSKQMACGTLKSSKPLVNKEHVFNVLKTDSIVEKC